MKSSPDQLHACYPAGTGFQLREHRQAVLPGNLHWQRIRLTLQISGETHTGLCLNQLRFPAGQMCPMPVLFHDNGRMALREDEILQQAIAHAYWQTRWAEAGIRAGHGRTEPVAFVAVDRASAFHSTSAPAEIFPLGEAHVLVGRENYFLSLLRQKLQLNWHQGRFYGRASDDFLRWLNARSFADRFIGDNAGLSGPIPISCFVPVSGSHTISGLMAGALPAYCDSRQPFSLNQVLAASNAGFFLNFPEEYANRWCAMNDPVGVLVEGGRLWQLPLVPRGACLVDSDDRVQFAILSMNDVALHLPWESHWRLAGSEHGYLLDTPDAVGNRVVVFTPAYRADNPPGMQRTPQGKAINLVVVFGKIVEVNEGGGLEVPANGVILSVPWNTLTWNRVIAAMRHGQTGVDFAIRPEKFGLEKLRTALGAGPILLHGKDRIRPDFFQGKPGAELFLPADFARAKRCAGVVPTRFPHDVTETRAPRTVLGLHDDRTLSLTVIDGRIVRHSIGATLAEAACLAQALGCREALNLDGGGSSVLYLAAARPLSALADSISPGIVNLPADAGHRDRLLPVPLLILDNAV